VSTQPSGARNHVEQLSHESGRKQPGVAACALRNQALRRVDSCMLFRVFVGSTQRTPFRKFRQFLNFRECELFRVGR
jgi:hypothetical protein